LDEQLVQEPRNKMRETDLLLRGHEHDENFNTAAGVGIRDEIYIGRGEKNRPELHSMLSSFLGEKKTLKSVAVCCSWILFKKILLNRNTTHTDRGAGDAVPVVPGGARAGASAARGVDGAERARGCGVRKSALIFYPLS